MTEAEIKSAHALYSQAKVALEPEWKEQLRSEFARSYMVELRRFLRSEYASGQTVFPKKSEYFAALNATPFSKVKVVILGQDPYHGPGQAHGLSFSVREGVAFPPSLQNIFKELKGDLGIAWSKSGDLTAWAKQGVLLLNSVLTVREGEAASHKNRGWEQFTDAVIQKLALNRHGLVFVLWGAYAQKKGAFIDRSQHLVLECVHPSPLSAHRGFFGSRPFSKINTYLREQKHPEIQWQS